MGLVALGLTLFAINQIGKEKEREALKLRKLAEQRKKDELAALFTPIDIVQPKIPFGVGKG